MFSRVRPSVERLSAAVILIFSCSVTSGQVVVTTVTDLGDSCGNPPPKISVTRAVAGQNAVLCIDSNLPGVPGSMEGHLAIFASFPPPPPPYPVLPPTTPGFGSCTIYVDLNNLYFFLEAQTDAQGDWCGVFPIPNDPSIIGQSVNIQARVWAAGGPFEGGDHLSNGIQLRFGTENGGEGNTPGFWKQEQHFVHWTAPYAPSTHFGSVFDDAFPGLTLLDVLNLGGSGLNALGRHTVAALLNAASPGLDFPLTTTQVITLFNGAFPKDASGIEALKDYFDAVNNLGGSI